MYGLDQISQIDTPGASKLAFTAKHALFNFFLQKQDFTPLQISMNLPDVKVGKLPCSTGSSACPAGNADI